MSKKLNDFIEAQKNRHEFLVMEQQLSEQRIIDELSEKLEPIKARVSSLEHSRTWIKGGIAGLSVAWGAVVAFLTHGGKLK